MICFKQPRRTAEVDSHPRIEMTLPHKDGGSSVDWRQQIWDLPTGGMFLMETRGDILDISNHILRRLTKKHAP